MLDKRSSPAGAKWKLVAQAAFDDVAFGIRGLARAPAFSGIVIVTFALALGVNAAVWSFVDPVLFRPPAGVRDPARIRRLYSDNPDASWAVDGHAVNAVFSLSEFEALEQAVGSTGTMAALRVPDSTAIESGRGEIPVARSYVAGDYFGVLSGAAAFGRFFDRAHSAGDDADEADISYSLWERGFGKDRAIVGRVVSVDDRRVTIIGVAARNFAGIDVSRVDLWMQYGSAVSGDGARSAYRDNRALNVVARIGHGADSAVLVARATVGYRTVAASMQKGNDQAGYCFGADSQRTRAGDEIARRAACRTARRGGNRNPLVRVCECRQPVLGPRGNALGMRLRFGLALGEAPGRASRGKSVRRGPYPGIYRGRVCFCLGRMDGRYCCADCCRQETQWATPAAGIRLGGLVLALSLLSAIISESSAAIASLKADLEGALKRGGRRTFERSRPRSVPVDRTNRDISGVAQWSGEVCREPRRGQRDPARI